LGRVEGPGISAIRPNDFSRKRDAKQMSAAGQARSLDNPPPHNQEAERSILGAILLDNNYLAVALKLLSTEDFFVTLHKKVFRFMIQMADHGDPIDSITLMDTLRNAGELRDPVDVAYVAGLTDGVPRISNVEHHAQIVRRNGSLRRLARTADNISRAALEKGADFSVLQGQLRAIAAEDIPVAHIGANGHLAYQYSDFMNAQFPSPEHLIEIADSRGDSIAGLLPSNQTSMVFSMPHHLKSWWTTSLALACTKPGIKFGKLLVKKPVRTYLIQMEDFPGQLQWRIGQLARQLDINVENFAVLPRCDHNGNKIDIKLPSAETVTILKREIEWFKPELIIFDVLRRIVNVDLNSPKESAGLLEQIDSFRYCSSLPHIMLVHHENRKEADIMYASAGSYNLPGWANVMIQFKRKREENGVSHVEIEVDNKLAQSPEPMRMVLDLKSETPVRLENLEETSGVQELRDALGIDWTERDLGEVMDLPRSSARRRLKKLIASGLVEKVRGGKRGRGGLAHFHFVGE
jgi:DnaB-like helicase N terminal domain/AAA domain